MRTNLMRSFAIALGVSLTTIAHAQFGASFTQVQSNPYADQTAKVTSVKERWNNLNAPSNVTQVAATGSPYNSIYRNVAQTGDSLLPTPQVENVPPGIPTRASDAQPATQAQTAPQSPQAPCASTSPYATALNQPWDGGCGSVPVSTFDCQYERSRPELFPYFGQANLLFLKYTDNTNRSLAVDGVGQTIAGSNGVDPDSTLGFDIGAGRYVKCGQYGLGLGYFGWNPGAETRIYSGAPGFMASGMAAYRQYEHASGGGPGGTSLYDQIAADAENVRVTRDLSINGLEANLYCFGLLGYGRSTPECGSNGIGRGPLSKWAGHHGFGRLGGPLSRPSANRLQIVNSHGLRWFQINDDAELAYNIDATPGYQTTDMYDSIDVKNDLYGYQFGSTLSYCLSDRINMVVGGKIGLYGNDVEARRRIGNAAGDAYVYNTPASVVNTQYDDTVLATLGELNCGLNYRLSDAWTVTGGYRVIGASGIASSFGQMTQDFGSSGYPGSVHANDSLLLHGAYLGAMFNW